MMSGMIIGVGFFALPYIAANVGLITMLAYLVILTIIVIIIHQYYAEIALRTPDFLRLPSYVGIYLGKTSKKISLIVSIIGFSGTSLAYIVIGGEFLTNLLMPILGGSQFLYAFIYFAAGSLLVFLGIKAVSKIEFLDVSLFLIILVAVFGFGWNHFKASNLFSAALNFKNIFLPYGAVLFALWGGANIISEVEEMLGQDKHLLKKIVAWSIILPAIFYAVFIIAVMGISGSAVSQESIAGLKGFLPSGVIALLFVFGLIAIFTSYVALGLILRNILWYDAKIGKNLSWAFACFAPFILYLLGFKNLIIIIGFVGATTLAIKGILIILMYQKIKPGRTRWATYPLILILALGIVYEIIYFIK